MAEFLPVGTPVSQALVAEEDIRNIVQSVLRAVDSVHGDGELPTIPVGFSASLTGEYAEASYYYDALLGDAIDIRMRYDAETPELSFLHELAHFIDHKGLAFPFNPAPAFGLTTETVRQAVFASESDSLFSEWRKAISVSEAVARLREVINYRSATVPLADGTEVAVDIDRVYVDYLLEPRELFARSYTQYVVTNSQNRVLQGQLDSQRQEPLANLYPIYWEDEDFVPVAEAVDSILQQRGWLK